MKKNNYLKEKKKLQLYRTKQFIIFLIMTLVTFVCFMFLLTWMVMQIKNI